LDPTLSYAMSILEIIVINVALSGDNAVVIAMAAHKLPAPRRRTVIFWGGMLAVLTQAIFSLFIARLIRIPGLRSLGAVMLAGIACKLLQEETEELEASQSRAQPGVQNPILRIALANLVMSLDNVMAIAGTCQSDPVRLVVALLVSMAIILGFSALIVKVLNRFKWIAYVGASMLAITAASMLWPELETAVGWARAPSAPEHLGLALGWSFNGLIVLACLSSPWWWPTIERTRNVSPRFFGWSKPPDADAETDPPVANRPDATWSVPAS